MGDKEKQKIVFLAALGRATNIIYNSLKKDFEIAAVIIEEPVSKKSLLKRRIHNLGLLTVFGQLIFQMIIAKILTAFSGKRIKEILEEGHLEDREFDLNVVCYVSSVNDEACAKLLRDLSPDIVIVNGTRIISQNILNSISGKFINMHAGITPKYRGVHGGYWALANKDPENCGVTIHQVDSGIDTGYIISQAIIKPCRKDNFSTYPYLQLAVGIPLLKNSIRSFSGTMDEKISNLSSSKLWYHPTFGQYFYNLISKGVK